MKMISVIVPVYNTPLEYLEKCINSILTQSYTNFELIIIDDGSKEKCAEYLDVKAGEDNRIIVKHIQNAGVSHARNEGLDMAKGDYVCFVDSDDWILEGYFKDAIQYIETYDLDIIVGSSVEKTKAREEKKLFFDKGKKLRVYQKRDLKDFEKKLVSEFPPTGKKELKNYCGWSPGKLYRKSCIEKVRFLEDVAFREDTLFNLAVLKNVSKIGLTNHLWYVYNINEQSTSQKFRINVEDEMRILLKEMKRMISNDRLENAYYAQCISCFNQIMRLNICHKDSQCGNKLEATQRLLNNPVYQKAFCNIDCSQFIMPNKNKLLIWLGKKKMCRGVLFLHCIRAKS